MLSTRSLLSLALLALVGSSIAAPADQQQQVEKRELPSKTVKPDFWTSRPIKREEKAEDLKAAFWYVLFFVLGKWKGEKMELNYVLFFHHRTTRPIKRAAAPAADEPKAAFWTTRPIKREANAEAAEPAPAFWTPPPIKRAAAPAADEPKAAFWTTRPIKREADAEAAEPAPAFWTPPPIKRAAAPAADEPRAAFWTTRPVRKRVLVEE
ncbi:hypothetical protein JCM11641_001612 [Rhodosporidiobolus odoratus]